MCPGGDAGPLSFSEQIQDVSRFSYSHSGKKFLAKAAELCRMRRPFQKNDSAFMHPHARRYSLPFAASVGLLILAMEFVAPGWVQAACGDHVSFGSQHSSTAPMQMPDHNPCTGPCCERGQDPAPQPPTIVPQGAGDAACLSRIRYPGGAECISPWVDRGESQARIHHTASIFHPPRCA